MFNVLATLEKERYACQDIMVSVCGSNFVPTFSDSKPVDQILGRRTWTVNGKNNMEDAQSCDVGFVSVGKNRGSSSLRPASLLRHWDDESSCVKFLPYVAASSK
jgi:hypothetical protein